MTPGPSLRRGLAAGIAAYAAWGVVPLYWKLLAGISPVEILAHRAVWGLVAFAVMAAALGQLPAIRAALRDRRAVAALSVTAALLAVNWALFIWATLNGHLLQASLGYFINPLVSVALGVIVLGERLRRWQWVAIALAAAGVGRLAWSGGGVPWISLGLAGTFGVYGLVRKQAPVAALAGSTIETALMAPVGAGYLVWLAAHDGGALGHVDTRQTLLLLATGVVTALPLAWFTVAARSLPLSVVGFLQYLAPTGQFLTAVLVFDEPLAPTRLHAFLLIWAALAVFSLDLARSARRRAGALDAEARAEAERLRRPAALRPADWFGEYHDYRAISSHLAGLAAEAPERVSVHGIGSSIDGRTIWAVRIGGTAPDAVPMLINGTLHAREWISAMAVTCIADRLVRGRTGGVARAATRLRPAPSRLPPHVRGASSTGSSCCAARVRRRRGVAAPPAAVRFLPLASGPPCRNMIRRIYTPVSDAQAENCLTRGGGRHGGRAHARGRTERPRALVDMAACGSPRCDQAGGRRGGGAATAQALKNAPGERVDAQVGGRARSSHTHSADTVFGDWLVWDQNQSGVRSRRRSEVDGPAARVQFHGPVG